MQASCSGVKAEGAEEGIVDGVGAGVGIVEDMTELLAEAAPPRAERLIGTAMATITTQQAIAMTP